MNLSLNLGQYPPANHLALLQTAAMRCNIFLEIHDTTLAWCGSALPWLYVVQVRDVLQHISAKDGAAAAKNIKDSGAKYVISTTW